MPVFTERCSYFTEVNKMGKNQAYGSRQSRRGNLRWEEMGNFMQLCRKLLSSVTLIYPYISNTQLAFNMPVENRADLSENCKVMTNDIRNFTASLTEIESRHRGRTGVVSMDQYMEAYDISQAYIQWSADFRTVVWPVMSYISKLLNVDAEFTNMLNQLDSEAQKFLN